MNATGAISCCAAAVTLWLTPSPAQPAPILGQEDWDPISSAAAWTNLRGWTSPATPNADGNTGESLRMTFPYVAASETGRYDGVCLRASNLFAGAWATNMPIRFDFWASNNSPGAAQVQWGTNGLGGDIREAVVDTPGTGTWTTLNASLLNWSNWMYDGAIEAQYLSDLASIDWIGVPIDRHTAGHPIHGIDNVMLMIPEPAGCLMLVLALVTMGISVRRKRPPPGSPSAFG